MRKSLFALIFILILSSAQADDPPAEERQPTVTYFVRPPEDSRVSKNMIFLFDCSTSMGRNNRFQTALREVRNILSYPVDEAMFSLIAFKAEEYEFSVWPGMKEEDDPNPPPRGWAKLPSVNASKSANDFLNKILCNSWTDIGTAIKKAFDFNADRENLTIILFTDGNNTFPFFRGKRPSQVVEQISSLQKARTDRGKDRIKIFVFGVSAEQNVIMLSAIARAGQGGYLTTDQVCERCRANKEDVAEVQRVHRSMHLPPDHSDYDGDAPDLDPDDVR